MGKLGYMRPITHHREEPGRVFYRGPECWPERV